MPKRAKSDTLTGGTKDVNPQWWVITTTQATADAITTLSYPLPVQRLQQGSDKSMVMEILGIYWDMPVYALVSAQTLSLYAFLTTNNPNVPAAPTVGILQQIRARGTCIDYINRQMVSNVAPTNENVFDEPIYHPINDGAGHGLLIGTDSVYMTLVTSVPSTTAALNNVTARILYRLKEVTIQEYVGIVQSQQ